VAAGIVERFAALGHPIVYISTAPNRHGFKAGALDAGLKVAKGEFVAIFDADFCAAARLAHEGDSPTLPSRRVGMVQTRWSHMNRD